MVRPSGSVFGAIPLASFGAAAIGTTLTLIYMLLDDIRRSIERGIFWEVAPDILNQNFASAIFGLPLGTFVGTFLVAGYLLLFGLPIALLFHSRLRGLAGLTLSIGTALLASLVAFAAFFGSVGRLTDISWHAPALVLAFALPAALLYRHSVILLLDEPI